MSLFLCLCTCKESRKWPVEKNRGENVSLERFKRVPVMMTMTMTATVMGSSVSLGFQDDAQLMSRCASLGKRNIRDGQKWSRDADAQSSISQSCIGKHKRTHGAWQLKVDFSKLKFHPSLFKLKLLFQPSDQFRQRMCTWKEMQLPREIQTVQK